MSDEQNQDPPAELPPAQDPTIQDQPENPVPLESPPDEMQTAEEAISIAAAPPPPEHHEYTLALDTEVLANQLQYLEALQRREQEPLLQGVIDFMTILSKQAFLRYGLVTPDAADLLVQLAESNLDAEDLDDAVHTATSLQATNVNNQGVGAQVRCLVERLGLEETRRLLQQLTASTNPDDDEEAPVPAGP